MSEREKWPQTPGQTSDLFTDRLRSLLDLGTALYKNLRFNLISYMPLIGLLYHTLPCYFPPALFLSLLSQSISAFLCLYLTYSDTHTHTHFPQYTHTHMQSHYSLNLRASRCRMASECEKGTSSSVYRALLSTHPFPQWPH